MYKMNSEKIRELAKQSGFYFYDLHDIDGQDLGETIESDSWDSADKFAELIIKECLSKIELQRSSGENTDQWTITRDMCYLSMIADLKNHFGIEGE